jgi:hypothetical protein
MITLAAEKILITDEIQVARRKIKGKSRTEENLQDDDRDASSQPRVLKAELNRATQNVYGGSGQRQRQRRPPAGSPSLSIYYLYFIPNYNLF